MWQVRLRKDNGTELPQDIYDESIGARWFTRSTDVSQSRVVAFHIELILERYGNAVQWTNQFAVISQMVVKPLCLRQSIIKADLGQTVCLARGVNMQNSWSSSNHLPSAVLDKLFADVS